MPSSHRRYRDWTHERIRREAALIGSDTAVLVDVIMHPEQGFRSCIGIIGLVKRFGFERVDAACARALVLGTRSYSSVAAILKNHREHTPTTTPEAPMRPRLLPLKGKEMLIHPTVERLRALGLAAMAERAQPLDRGVDQHLFSFQW